MLYVVLKAILVNFIIRFPRNTEPKLMFDSFTSVMIP